MTLRRILISLAALAALCLADCGGSSSNSASSGGTSGTSSSSSSSGGTSSSGSGSSSGATPATNQATIVVDNGPVGSSFNQGFVSVTICVPNSTSACVTIDHILVDTGSFGLRLVSSAALTSIGLPPGTASGNPLFECAEFGNFYTWGSVRTADIHIGGELASSVAINVLGDSSLAAPSACSSSGTPEENSVSALAANGILGIGVFVPDCGDGCVSTTSPQTSVYYSCTSTVCTAAGVPLAHQVSNPIAFFATDNNGSLIAMPSLGTGDTALDPTGMLTFGIATETNNQLASTATVLQVDPGVGNFTTVYRGTTYTDGGFIDSGSNFYFLSDTTIPTCTGSLNGTGFYCPTSEVSVTATNHGYNPLLQNFTGATASATINIANAQNELSADITAADNIGVSNSGSSLLAGVDFGMPFFYGRTIYTAIQGTTAAGTAGPYVAY